MLFLLSNLFSLEFYMPQDDSTNKIAQFLARISQIESSGGLNTVHPELTSGIHSGEHAFGKYGLMPNTIREMAKRSQAKELQPLLTIPTEQLYGEMSQHPEYEDKIAQTLAQHVLNREGDEDKAAYAWNMGHNLPVERITDEKLNSSPYVQKFRLLKQLITQK